MAARPAGLVALALGLLAASAQAAGPVPTAQPTIAGTVATGDRLTAGPGTWTSSSRVGYAYQWYRCNPAGARCLSIHGATAAGLTLGPKDTGATIGLTVTAADEAGSTPAYASLVGPVARAKPLLVSTAQPQITGLPIEGRLLQVTAGAWSPAPTGLAYSWRRCNANGRVCVPIPRATASVYTVTGADVGHALAVLVEARFGTTTQSALSTASAAAIGADAVGPSHTAAPVVAGVAQQGAQLTATAGLWAGIGSLSYAYQWYRCDADGAHCSSIRGATKTTYRTVAADADRTLGFTVRATDSTGTTAAYASLFGPVAPARAAVAATAPPVLTGSAHPGSILTVSAGTWQRRIGTLSYAWRRCNENGRICTPIRGARRTSYQVTTADVGHALVAVVRAAVDRTSQAAYSTASARVT